MLRVSQVRREKRCDSLVVSEHPVNGARQFRLVCMRERYNDVCCFGVPRMILLMYCCCEPLDFLLEKKLV